MRFLLLQDVLDKGSPSLTWKDALDRAGATTRLRDLESLSDTSTWLRDVYWADQVLLVLYNGLDEYRTHQLSLAPALGRPVTRVWVGPDVNSIGKDQRARVSAKRIQRIASRNLAKGAHLVEELAAVGIRADSAALVIVGAHVEAPKDQLLPKSCLVYLPTDRGDIYGFSIVERAITTHPNLHFIVVADEKHSLAHYPNVESLGWVDDLSAIWSRTGALLRMTTHDGTPRMVLEALARGKLVLFSHHMTGCVLVRSFEELLPQLEALQSGMHHRLPSTPAAESLGGIGAARVLYEQLASVRLTVATRLSALAISVPHMFGRVVSKLKRSRLGVISVLSSALN